MQTTESKPYHANWAALVKLAYLLAAGAAMINFLLHWRGGSSLAAAAAEASVALLYAVAAVIVIFGLAIVGSSFRTPAPQRERR